MFNIAFLLIIIHQSSASEWNYDGQGPDVWSDTYSSCSGHFQSPINIRTACTVYQSYEPFRFSSNYGQEQKFMITNNGHTISGASINSESSLLILNGGGLNGVFEFVSFHIHWGENYKSGSEHQINGEKYAGEIHLVHRNPTTTALAVLGMFLQSSASTNTNETSHVQKRKRNSLVTQTTTLAEWERYFSVAKKLEKINATVVLNLNLLSLMSTNLDQFWRYTGSLTTPPCTEGIIWSVFKQPIIVNPNQLSNVRNNIYPKAYRSPQPLYNRIVYRNFLYETVSSIPDYNCCLKTTT